MLQVEMYLLKQMLQLMIPTALQVYIVTLEIYTDNEAGNFGHAWIIDIIQQHLAMSFHH